MKLNKFLCAAVAAIAIPAIGTAETVKVGVVQALSGPPSVVDFGESYLQGIKLATQDYMEGEHKYDIETIIYNDEANPQRAVSLVERLIVNDGVSAIVGTVNAASVNAFAPLTQEARIPLMIGPSTASTITEKFINEEPSFVFRCSVIEQNQTDAVLEWSFANFENVGVIHTTSGYGMFVIGELEKGAAAHGEKFAIVESATPTATDLTPQILKLKNAGADLVLVYFDSMELVYRGFDKLDYHPATAGPWGMSSKKALAVIGKDKIEGAVMVQALDLSTPNAMSFDVRMKEAFGEEYRWPVVAALGYDAMKLVISAIDESGSDPEAIRDALENLSGYSGASAVPEVPFSKTDHECLESTNLFMGAWKDGEVVRLE